MEPRKALKVNFCVYMLRCANGSILQAMQTIWKARLEAHPMRVFSGYTASRLPVRLLFHEQFATRDQAFARERQIKGWSRRKKLALASGDWAAVRKLSAAHGSTGSP